VEPILVEAVTAPPTAAAVLSFTENKSREVPLFVPSLEGIQKKKEKYDVAASPKKALVGFDFKVEAQGVRVVKVHEKTR
jgi:hypothetical protein